MQTLVSQLETDEILGKPTTEVPGYQFNSMCKFGDDYLACDATGLHSLGGTTFNGTDIDAEITTRTLDLESASSIHTVYVGMYSADDMTLTPTRDDAAHPAITIDAHKTGQQHTRAVLARGAAGRFWKFNLANVDGGDFTLNLVQALPRLLGRAQKNH